MADMMDQWSSDANEAISMSMVQPGPDGLEKLSTFHPKFTYPIFGEEERIFGYQGLSIDICFAAHDLRPNVNIYYDKKFSQVGDTAALDIKKSLADFMPKDSFAPVATYRKAVHDDENMKDFKPPGQRIKTYTTKGKEFGIWTGTLADREIRLLLDRMQIFISFFIEGGTPIKLDDQEWTLERWSVFFLFEILPEPATPTSSVYSLAGYATTYRFWAFPSIPSGSPTVLNPYPPSKPIAPVKLPSRLRISQFLLLPSYRAAGHGTALYLSIYNHALSDPLITEVTVEDPNEEFDALRDYADYATLLHLFMDAGITLNPTPIPVTARKPKKVPTSLLLPIKQVHALRKQQKIAPRQFARVLEMHLLGSIPPENRVSLARITQKHRASNENDRKYYWWRLLVKQRIYKKQYDILMQLDPSERVEALDRAASSQQEEYTERMDGFFSRLMKSQKEGQETGEGSEEAKVNGGGTKMAIVGASEVASARAKRKVIIEDEDDDSEGSKRIKL